jgi:hypothetical protein
MGLSKQNPTTKKQEGGQGKDLGPGVHFLSTASPSLALAVRIGFPYPNPTKVPSPCGCQFAGCANTRGSSF